MLIAVGMYLPFDTSSAIFVGGVLKWLVDRLVTRQAISSAAPSIEETGTLLGIGS